MVGTIANDVENWLQAMYTEMDKLLKPINTSQTQTSFIVRGINEQNLWNFVRERNLEDTFKSEHSRIAEGHKFSFRFYECEKYLMDVILRWHSEDPVAKSSETYSASQCWTAKIEVRVQYLDDNGNAMLRNPSKKFLTVDQASGTVGRSRNDTSLHAHIPLVDDHGSLRRSPPAVP